jgi:hypothetical protein
MTMPCGWSDSNKDVGGSKKGSIMVMSMLLIVTEKLVLDGEP